MWFFFSLCFYFENKANTVRNCCPKIFTPTPDLAYSEISPYDEVPFSCEHFGKKKKKKERHKLDVNLHNKHL